jgi:tetratricopeptide (TPR) repeat protein
MMNLEEIAQRIKDPNLCGSKDIDQLHQLTNKYPYSQAFSILYLKSLSVNNDVRFDDELQLHAYKITDRMRLFELINEKEKITEEVIQVEEIIKVQEVTPEKTDIEEEETPSIDTENSEETEELKESGVLADIQQVEKTYSTIVPIENQNISSESDLSTSDSDEDMLEIVLDIATPISDTQEKEVEAETQAFEQEEQEEAITEIEIPEELSNNNSILPETIQIEQQIQEEELEELQVKDASSHVSNSINLENNSLDFEILTHAISSNYSLVDSIPIPEEQEMSSSVVEEIEIESFKVSSYTLENVHKKESKKAFSSWLKSNKNENYDEVDESKKKIDTIVRQFISEEPSISRPIKVENAVEKPKTDFFSPIKKAKESLNENTLPVSETLAKIFAAQGNFPKAIYAYEQLIVIYPEKKIFFVNQIEELTKKLNA